MGQDDLARYGRAIHQLYLARASGRTGSPGGGTVSRSPAPSRARRLLAYVRRLVGIPDYDHALTEQFKEAKTYIERITVNGKRVTVPRYPIEGALFPPDRGKP